MKTKAAVLYKTGEPLVVDDGIELPALRPGQVLVEMAYSGICHSQLMEIRGKRGEDRYLPHLLGHEGSGVVVDVGQGVSKVSAGERVVLTWIRGEGAEIGGSEYRKGDVTINAGAVTTFSEHTVISENRCVGIPDDTAMDVAAILGCAALTGCGMVMNTIRPERSDRIAVFGLGGIGMCAVMAARLCGCAAVVAVDVEDEKLALARSLGASHCVNAAEVDPVEVVRGLTDGAGVDAAVEATGRASVIEQAFASVRRGGGLCVFAGHPPSGARISIDPFELICGKRILGSWGGDAKPDRDIPLMIQWHGEGKLPIEKLITHRYRLEDINQAFSDLENRLVGRAILELGESQ